VSIVRGPDVVTAVVVDGGAKVEARGTVGSPSATSEGRVVDQDDGANGCDGVSIEVIRLVVEAMPRRESRVGGPRAQVVEGEFHLVEGLSPEEQREGGRCGGESGDDMIFCCADRALRAVGAVVVGGCILEREFACFEKSSEFGRGLIIEALEVGSVAEGSKEVVGALVARGDVAG
jgi:hypothetical protein